MTRVVYAWNVPDKLRICADYQCIIIQLVDVCMQLD